MTYFVALFVLWAADHLTWANAGMAIGAVYAYRRLVQYVFTRWLPTYKVAELMEAAADAAETKWKARVDELEVSVGTLTDEVAYFRRLSSSQEDTIIRQRVEIGTLEAKLARATGRSEPQKPAPKRPSTWWEVLGVDRAAPRETVEAAYRRMARSFHPDAPGGDLSRMQEINAAMDHYRRHVKA